MRYTADYLYNLLPAVYRLRDEEQGYPMRALMAVIAPRFDSVEDSILELYDDWFAETAQEWVIPYLGDLLGMRPLNPVSGAIFSQRALVANTLSYRRRKGTLSVLERLARDVTGWPAHAVEYFELLETTQFLNHIRLQNVRTPDLRNANALELLNGPFETSAHTAEVRRIRSERGRYNIPNIGLHLWRLQSYPLTGVTAFKLDDHRYFFSPLGRDMPLFSFPQPPGDDLTDLSNVPLPFTRRLLRQFLAQQYGKSLRLIVDGIPVPASQIIVCNLADKSAAEWAHQPTAPTIAIDPVLGRIAFAAAVTPAHVLTDQTVGFSGDLGGGPYNRADSLAAQMNRPDPWHIAWCVDVINGAALVPNSVYPTLADAITAWNAQPDGTHGAIVLPDSQTHVLAGAMTIDLRTTSRLLIVGGTWPFDSTTAEYQHRTFDQLRAAPVRPHIKGNMTVKGATPAADKLPGVLAMNGLLVEGILTVEPGDLGTLQLAHCTLVPGTGSIFADKTNLNLTVTVERCITGPLTLEQDVPGLVITDSIVQAKPGPAIGAPGAVVTVQASTILGQTQARILNADNSIFTDQVRAERRQVGCMRFCFIGALDLSRTPRRYRCQPDLALAQRQQALAPNLELPAAERNQILERLVPRFTSRRYGLPAYGQLSIAGPMELATGGEDGAEMGAFYFLKQPQREANLRASLDEYLRVGLEAGIFFAT